MQLLKGPWNRQMEPFAAPRPPALPSGMGFAGLGVERDGDTVRITMNRPERRNALSADHLVELRDAFSDAGRSDATGIVLGAKGKAFSAGHDFADVSSRNLAGVRELLVLSTDVMRAIQSVPQVVVARVHALATAAGCQLVASCDLAVAAESAGFALPGGKDASQRGRTERRISTR